MEKQDLNFKKVSPLARTEAEEFALIDGVLSGRKDLFEILVAPYERHLLLRALKIVRSPVEAQDVLQEGLWKTFKHLATFRRESSFDAWVTKIVINEARMSLRRSTRRRCSALTSKLENSCYCHFSDILQENPKERESRVLEAVIADLPEAYRAAVLLRLGKLSTRECSSRLRISPTAFKSRHFRALRLLRQRLNPEESNRAVQRA